MYGWLLRNRRYGGVFQEELRLLEQREYFSRDEWDTYQDDSFKKILSHAYKTVPFYKEAFKYLGLDEGCFSKLDLRKLPFLEKKDLREFGKTSLISDRAKKWVFFSSSGSTGTPTQIYYSREMHQRWFAAYEARVRNWAGVSINSKRGMIGGRRVVPNGIAKPPFYRYNTSEKQVYFSAYHINAGNLSGYLKGLEEYEVDYMTGYAMSNYFLARLIEESGLKAPPLKAVLTSSEKLTSEMRETFRRVYGCKTYDAWSGVEACGLISESEYGQLLINPDMGIIEVIKENGEYAKPGEVGEVVCTGLLNFDQPLIRYRIGDMIRLAQDQTTLCGRSMIVVEEIVGRVEDTVVASDGSEMVRFHGVFVDLVSVLEAQVIQLDYDKFKINIVPAKDEVSKEDKEKIVQRMISQLGEVDVDFDQLIGIPRNSNGKFKAVISNIKRK
jgi:phenylacetate-CoA ligase